MIEVKSPENIGEMISEESFNNKALHEILLYYYEQRENNVTSVNKLIITDCKNVYLFSSNEFEKLISNKKISNLLSGYKNKELEIIKKTSDFYDAVSKLLIVESIEITATKINLFDDSLDHELAYRFFDKYNLLGKKPPNDANELNREFYYELLYIMGLIEKDNILVKSDTKNSLLDITEEMIGDSNKEILFEKALGLNILWLNRILFIKILESQLQVFRDDKDYTILSPKNITGYDLLSKLFFKILSTPRNERHEENKKYDLIPYLNSSLFEETLLEKTYSIRDLDIERNIVIMQGSVLYNDKNFKEKRLNLLNYLLSFLNCFSFNRDNMSEDTNTVIKSSVLGLVFEKLNGYKDGSHFTPPSITMYMSRNVIERLVVAKFNLAFSGTSFSDYASVRQYAINNFHDKEKRSIGEYEIDNIKIIDPAVGSGHFLVSCLNELIRIKSDLKILHDDVKINIENDELIVKYINGYDFIYQIKGNKINDEQREIQKKIFDTKKHIIENQLYGIDINPNSVNIARLRLWIELLKHSYYTDDKHVDLEALPNLEFKIMTANSLLALKKSNAGLVSTDYEPLKNSLKNKFGEYFEAVSNKAEIKESIKNILDELKGMTTFDDDSDQVRQLADFSPFNTTVSSPFFDSEFMFGVDNFDIVLMNPPYFGLVGSHSYKHLMAAGDIYQIFLERAFDFINDNGIVSAIVSNKWMRAGYGERTRTWLYQKAYVHEILDLGAGWFDSATVDTNIITYEKSNDIQTSIFAQTLSRKIEDIAAGKSLAPKNSITMSAKGDSFIILSATEKAILDKMISFGKPLKDWDISINYGIKTGFNEAFIIDSATKDSLIEEDSKSAEIIKPLLRGRDIKRYSYEFADKWIIGTFPALHLNIDDYPTIKKYLESFRPRIDQTGEKGSRKKTPNKWFETQDTIAYYKDFEKPKIVYAETMRVHKSENSDRFPRFSYIIDNSYTDKTCFIIVGEKLHYILGILNSHIIEFFIHQNVAVLDTGGFLMQKIYVEIFPIPTPTKEQENIITALVKTILNKKSKSEDTIEEEKEIDIIVYGLYNLSEEEILLVRLYTGSVEGV